jgi:hypothetical protein
MWECKLVSSGSEYFPLKYSYVYSSQVSFTTEGSLWRDWHSLYFKILPDTLKN